MRMFVLAGLIALEVSALGGCAPAPGAGAAAPGGDLTFRCSAESRMAASGGATRTDARLAALDARRDCIDAGGPPPLVEHYGM
jgi:hypothetical protein